MTESFFYSSTPVFTVDGEDRGELARDLLRLEVDETTDGLKTLQARFVATSPHLDESQQGISYLDGRILDFGKHLRVSIGPPELQRIIFDGYLSALEADLRESREHEISAYAEDRLMDLRMTRQMRTYENASDADIAAEIAAEHGLTPAIDAAGPTYERVQQWNMSDLAFLRERGRLIQAEVWVVEDTLHFKTRDRREGTRQTLVRGADMISVQARADLSQQRTQVRISGYDAQARASIDETADDSAVQAEIAGGRTGPAVLQSAFGERVSHRVREVPLVTEEATDWARAEMLRRARGFVSVNGVARGMPDLTVGSVVELAQMGAPFNGAGYYVTRVRHTFDLGQGHRTQFQAERATLGAYA